MISHGLSPVGLRFIGLYLLPAGLAISNISFLIADMVLFLSEIQR